MYINRHFVAPHPAIANRIVISPSDYNFCIAPCKNNKFRTLKWDLDSPAFLFILCKLTTFASIEYVPVNALKNSAWLRLVFPLDFAKFKSAISTKSIGFKIVSPTASEVCAGTDASYDASGIAIRAIRINSTRFSS